MFMKLVGVNEKQIHAQHNWSENFEQMEDASGMFQFLWMPVWISYFTVTKNNLM